MTTMEISKICYDLGIKYVDNNVFGTKLWYKKLLLVNLSRVEGVNGMFVLNGQKR